MGGEKCVEVLFHGGVFVRLTRGRRPGFFSAFNTNDLVCDHGLNEFLVDHCIQVGQDGFLFGCGR